MRESSILSRAAIKMEINKWGLTEFDQNDIGKQVLYGAPKKVRYCSCPHCTCRCCVREEVEFVLGTIIRVCGNHVGLKLEKMVASGSDCEYMTDEVHCVGQALYRCHGNRHWVHLDAK